MSNAERNIEVEMDEVRMVDIANGDSESRIVIEASRGPVLPANSKATSPS